MVPVLQIAISELPVKIKHFENIELIQIFLDSQRLPINTPAKNGGKWLIKTYSNKKGFKKAKTPEHLQKYRKFPVKWSIGDNDFPTWEEAWEFVDLTEINNDENLSSIFFDQYSHYFKIKIGGFASYIQSPGLEDNEFLIQISSEEKPRFMIGDNGNLYIGITPNGEWFLHWDCY